MSVCKPIVKFVISLTSQIIIIKKSAQPLGKNYFFNKIWVFYNGGCGLFSER